MVDITSTGPGADAPAKALKRGKARDAEFEDALTALSAFEDARSALDQAALKLEEEIGQLKSKFDLDNKSIRDLLVKVSPLAATGERAPPTKRAAYSDRTCALMAKFALLAYKRFEIGDGKALLEALLKQAGFDLLATYNVNDTQAFLAQNHEFAVLAFRGTTSKQDWKINQQVFPRKAAIPGHPRDVTVHGGFLGAFLPIEVDVRLNLHNLTGERPIYICGHSLGGALALVSSAVLGGATAGSNLPPLGDRIAAVYTFGAPRVGKRSFETCVKAPHYRVVNKNDIVPWVPPTWLFGYQHSGDVRILRSFGMRPASQQFPTSLALTALWMLFLYVIGAAYILKLRSRGIEDHQIKRYVVKLDRIASYRAQWK